MKRPVAAEPPVGRLQLLEGGHERLGNEPPPEDAEAPLGVGKGGGIRESGSSLGIHGRFPSGQAEAAALAFSMKARTFSGSFLQSSASTPLEESTA